jgi:hypothetical protein
MISMAVPVSLCSYAVNVTTNIAICTLLAPLPYGAGAAGGVSQASQNPCEVLALINYEIAAGSTGVGTVLTFQTLGLDSTATTPVWRTLATGGGTSTLTTITLANSTLYGGILNGPFHGVRILISGVVGNGVAYARISSSLQ